MTNLGRVAIVTGGAGGIGWAVCRRLAARGDRVVLLDIAANADERAGELGAGHFGIRCDMADEAQVVAAFAAVRARYGRIDALINNAGIVDAAARPFLDAPLDSLRHLLGINLEGAFVAAREAGRTMLAQESGGAIVNVASLAGIVALPGRSHYAMSKAALIGMTRSLACEWAGSGNGEAIRVNAVLPGYVATDIIAALRQSGKLDLARVEQCIPLGRLAEPDEIAAVIEHLASPAASYVTGALVVADGGVQAFGGAGAAAAGGAAPPLRREGPRGVLVTGGASGIGAAIARHFVALGDRVLVFDRDAAAAKALTNELGLRHLACAGSVTSPGDAASAVRVAVETFGRLDVLINNAGIADRFEPTTGQSLAGFRQVIEVDLVGAAIVAQAAGAAMIAQGGGSIVQIGSIAGQAGLPRRNAYGAAKAGLAMLTRTLACEWAAHGIRVNTIAPGYVATPGVAALEAQGLRNLDAVRARTPLGRLGAPEEIAAVAAFLASDDASYVTGSLFAVDGGWSAFGDAGPAWEPGTA